MAGKTPAILNHVVKKDRRYDAGQVKDHGDMQRHIPAEQIRAGDRLKALV